MRLYHGTNVDFDVIDITKSQKFKDFGQGFYLTDIYTQAEELAKKKARLFGGSPVNSSLKNGLSAKPLCAASQRVL